MPPRRSGRTSLPTPAQSIKTESVSSTPGSAPSKGSRGAPRGLITPSSLTDEDEDVKPEMEMDAAFLDEAEPVSARGRGTKRKCEYIITSSS
jgi:hypothetical protein